MAHYEDESFDYNGMDYSEYYKYSSGDFDDGSCDNSSVRDFGQVFLPAMYSLIFVVGIIGNGLVVCVFAKNCKECSMADMCLFNLALSDILFVLTLPFWAHYAAVSDWTFGDFMCRVVTVMFTLGFYGSVFSIMIITMHHYVSIVCTRVKKIPLRSFRAAVILMGFVWLPSFCASLPTIVLAHVENKTGRCAPGFLDSTVWKQFMYLEQNILALILPLALMIFSYSQVIPVVLRTRLSKKQRAIKIILLVVTVYFIFWAPYNIVIFLHYLQTLGYFTACDEMTNINLAMQWTETIAFIHCCLNPLIYTSVSQKFSRQVLRIMKKWFPICFSHGKCPQLSREPSERRSSVHSNSTAVSSSMLL
ncbi:C-C chemokine receptor type 5-like [Chanos chanos]|uniref:C-C chemokine receptor type 5-like n=1 Tax=Chanos chanos TaxID=29144 RepID=A0A6J2W194_CHACN|nr:C-C chemokine receptor type 5-like [Chanos chanos]